MRRFTYFVLALFSPVCLSAAVVNLTVTIEGDNGTFGTFSGTGLTGDLRGAFNYINTQAAAGSYSIKFDLATPTINTTLMLPPINLAYAHEVTIDGTNSGAGTITFTGGRPFFVRQGSVTLQNFTINTSVTGGAGGTDNGGGGGGMGAGGCVFIDAATVTLADIAFTGAATGGAGGVITSITAVGSGAGGGMGSAGGTTRGGGGSMSFGAGAGGVGTNGGGGGGGGIGGDGGDGIPTGSGGGGGYYAAGADGGSGANGATATLGSIGTIMGGGGGGGGPATTGGAGGGNGGAGDTTSGSGGGGGSVLGTGSAAAGTSAGSGGTYGGGGGGGSGNGGRGGTGGLGGGGGAGLGARAGGAGGYGGGGGCGGNNDPNNFGGAGGFGGGGASGRDSTGTAGQGGFGGGGGGSAFTTGVGGTGGYGGGGGGGGPDGASGGIGAGRGGSATGGGGGGAAFGGAIFVNGTGSVILKGGVSFAAGTITAGTGGDSAVGGVSAGVLIFGAGGATLNFNPDLGDTISIAADNGIGDDSTNSIPGGSGVTSGSGTGVALLKNGSGTLSVSGAQTYANGTILNGGILQASSDTAFGKSGTTITFTQSGAKLQSGAAFSTNRPVSIDSGVDAGMYIDQYTLTLSGTITMGDAAASLTKTGAGTLVVTGNNTFSGITTVSEGTLQTGGTTGLSSASAITVQNGATLRIGTPIGTIPVPLLTLSPSSTLAIDVDASGAGQISSTGVATLDGVLNVIAAAGNYSSDYTQTILTASSLSGTFSSFTFTGSGLTASVVYNAASIVLQVSISPISLTGLTGNARVIATYLNSLVSSNISDLNSYIPILSVLPDAERNAALNSISAERSSLAVNAMMDTALMSSRVITGHTWIQRMTKVSAPPVAAAALAQREELLLASDEELPPQMPEPSGSTHKLAAEEEKQDLWVDGFGAGLFQPSTSELPSYKMSAFGAHLGYDFFPGNSLVGMTAGYLYNMLNYSGSSGDASANTFEISLYGSTTLGKFYFEGAVFGTYSSNKNSRFVTFSTFEASARGKTHTWQVMPHLGFGYDFALNWFFIEPFLQLDVACAFQSGYTETGASPFNMQIEAVNASQARIEGGCRFYQRLERSWGQFLLKETVSYVHKEPLQSGTVNAAIVGASSSYTIDIFTRVQNLCLLGVQGFLRTNGGWFFSCQADGQFQKAGGFWSADGQLEFGKYF